MRGRFVFACLIASIVGLASFETAAQVVPKELSEEGSKTARSDWTVGVVGGLFSGTYMRLAAEMADALDDGNNLRVLPIVSFGAGSNVDDLLYLHGVDLAITQSDVLEHLSTVNHIPNLKRRVQYIIRLPNSELHILARDEVHSLQDLRGKKVNFGPPGTGASLTGTIVFQRLGIDVQQVNIPQSGAIEKLKSGQIDAIARVIPKPVAFFSDIPPNSGLHLVNIPFTKRFEDHYTLGEFTKKDYPNLLDGKDRIDTIAVPAVLAVYNWPPNTEGYRKVQRFTQYLFNRWDTFQHPPYHPKWRDVNLAAPVPGWTRFGPAQEMLNQLEARRQDNQQDTQKDKQKADFQAFLNSRPDAPTDQAARDVLYRKFLQWQDQTKVH
jgi:TRAP transporter TAXI family solute receptor